MDTEIRLAMLPQRRGISRDTILAELRRMGTEIPSSSVEMLQVSHATLSCDALLNARVETG